MFEKKRGKVMKKKRLMLAVLTAFMVLPLVACRKEGVADNSKVSIGIMQYAEHPALDSAREGFIEALAEGGYKEGKNLKVTLKNAQGEQANLQTMVEQLAGKNNLNFAIATPAAQALLNTDPETPAVFTAVTDPLAAGLANTLNKPGKNMTGSIDATEVSDQIDLLIKVVPKAKRVGIFYNSSEVNSEVQVKAARKALEKKGMKVVEKTVTTSNDVQQVMTSLASQVDAVYLPTDNTVASTATTIGQVLKDAKVPALGSDEAYLQATLLTSGVDFKAIGKSAGKQALAILKGEKASDLAIVKPQKPLIAINEDMAKSLGRNVAELKALVK